MLRAVHHLRRTTSMRLTNATFVRRSRRSLKSARACTARTARSSHERRALVSVIGRSRREACRPAPGRTGAPPRSCARGNSTVSFVACAMSLSARSSCVGVGCTCAHRPAPDRPPFPPLLCVRRGASWRSPFPLFARLAIAPRSEASQSRRRSAKPSRLIRGGSTGKHPRGPSPTAPGGRCARITLAERPGLPGPRILPIQILAGQIRETRARTCSRPRRSFRRKLSGWVWPRNGHPSIARLTDFPFTQRPRDVGFGLERWPLATRSSRAPRERKPIRDVAHASGSSSGSREDEARGGSREPDEEPRPRGPSSGPAGSRISTRRAVLQDVPFRLAPVDDRRDMRAPCIQRRMLLVDP